jgi:hypothetical protein
MSEVKLHVGDVDDMGKRFIDAWKRLEDGQQVEERHLSFLVWMPRWSHCHKSAWRS